MNMEQILDKIKGTIYGQAIGDALGLGTEFMDDFDMAWKYPNGLTHYSEIYQDRHRRRWAQYYGLIIVDAALDVFDGEGIVDVKPSRT